MSELAQGFSDWHSINGSQEASCIYRKGFLWFLSFDLTGQMPHKRSAAWRAVRQRIGSFTATDMTDKTDIF